MFSNNHMKHGGCGCGCGCGGNHDRCKNAIGPFLAVDKACIVPPVNRGSIIPFSSGLTPVVLATVALGLVGVPQQIGFGTATPGVALIGNTIDLSSVVTEAFVVPRAGNITAISASFKELLGVALVGTTTINATIYKATGTSAVYTATAASVNLSPSITGAVSIGQIFAASANLAPIPVAQGDRLVMVYSITVSGVTVIQVLTGTASAGITIE
ncbi:exosporium glycoprotein BclB-related protein [Solibacillus cecembensis]|uniref:exosporium glycoprotein BclB-related protein n=1 Tax=Solibacillus cecembensis TaxID=459347 RepID=UPI003D0228B8